MPSQRTTLAAVVVMAVSCLAACEPSADDRDDLLPPPERSLPSRIAPTGAPGYTAWAGPGCTSETTYREKGRIENGDAAWYTVPSGGHRDDTCDGRFTALPMSGSATGDGAGSATWTWPVGTSFASCALAVFVPKGPRDIDVAGNPTLYRVLEDPDDPSSAYAVFGVRQPVHRGTLVEVGTYAVKAPTFTVQLSDRGRDWGDTSVVGAHHGAAQMKLTCRR
ncbi:adhesin [Streptomyces sp. NPDC013953]|uniref:adhesin n=1 Tax=Streptomyces sp. NPDC013953 TaxID=3364868 RepID=UPI0036F55E85